MSNFPNQANEKILCNVNPQNKQKHPPAVVNFTQCNYELKIIFFPLSKNMSIACKKEIKYINTCYSFI